MLIDHSSLICQWLDIVNIRLRINVHSDSIKLVSNFTVDFFPVDFGTHEHVHKHSLPRALRPNI